MKARFSASFILMSPVPGISLQYNGHQKCLLNGWLNEWRTSKNPTDLTTALYWSQHPMWTVRIIFYVKIWSSLILYILNIMIIHSKIVSWGDSSCGPVVEILLQMLVARVRYLKIPHAAWHGQKKKGNVLGSLKTFQNNFILLREKIQKLLL